MAETHCPDCGDPVTLHRLGGAAFCTKCHNAAPPVIGYNEATYSSGATVADAVSSYEDMVDRYRRAYKYLLDEMICCQGQIIATEEVWKWMDDAIKNARGIAGDE